MRLFALIIVSAAFFQGCLSGHIKTRKDEFTGNTVSTVSYKMIHSEEGFSVNADFDFIREYRSNIENSFTDVRIRAGLNSKDAEPKCFVKIDDITIDLELSSRKNEKVILLKNTASSAPILLNGGDPLTRMENNTEAADAHRELSGRIILPADFKSKVLSAKSIVFRFYLGADPVTFVLSPDWIENIKKFYRADE